MGSEKSIRKLKEKYNLKNKDGKELFVTLATQKQEGYRSSRDIILGIHGILQ